MNFDKKTTMAISHSSTEGDRVALLDHVVTRLEAIIATLQIRQKVEGSLQPPKPGEGNVERSIFDIIDQLLSEAGK